MMELGLLAFLVYKTLKDNISTTPSVSSTLPEKTTSTESEKKVTDTKDDDLSNDVIRITMKK